MMGFAFRSVLLSVFWTFPALDARAQPMSLPQPKYNPKEKKWGYVDPANKGGIAPRFDIARPFSRTDRLAAVKVGETYFYIDVKGKPQFDNKQFDFAGPFRDGLARVRKENKFALLKANGTLTDYSYEDLGDLSDGLIRARRDGLYSYLRADGTEKFQTRSDLVGDFHQGRAWFRDREKGTYGYIDSDGKIPFCAPFQAAGNFSSGLAPVRVKNSFLYIDLVGQHSRGAG